MLGRFAVVLLALTAAHSAHAQCTTDGLVSFVNGQDLESCSDEITIAGSGSFATGALSAAGDINGDGTEDFAVSDPVSGFVYVIFGQDETTLVSQLDLSTGELGFAIQGETGEEFGAVLAGGYDINSDGFDDLVIGSPGYNGGHGRAFIVFGNDLFQPTLNATSMDSRQVVQVVNGNFPNIPECESLATEFNSATDQCPSYDTTNFGLSASGVGDVNDDGLHDYLIGSHGGEVGAVLVFGRSLGATWDPVIQIADCDGATDCTRLVIEHKEGATENMGWGFGMAVTGGNDFNGDGLSDLMIGSPNSMVLSSAHAGLAAVFFGSDVQYNAVTGMRTLDGTTGYILFGYMEHALFGASVQALSDINGDGVGDYAVASPIATTVSQLNPHVSLFLGFHFNQETDENPRIDEAIIDGGFDSPQFPQKLFEVPTTQNSQCVDPQTGDLIPCSQGFVIKGPSVSSTYRFGASLSAGDLNNDEKEELIINVGGSSEAIIVWGQEHVSNFTLGVKVAGVQGSTVQSQDFLCYQAYLADIRWDDDAPDCGYMDLSGAQAGLSGLDGQVSVVGTGMADSKLTVIGDINKDSISDMAFVRGSSVFIVPGQCNDHGDGCMLSLNLPPGCKMDLSRLLVGFVDDDFIEWGRGYIRFVMDQMVDTVREAWDQNMIAKGFYVNTTATQRCWCSPPDTRGRPDEPDNWYWHCFEMDDLVCSDPQDDTAAPDAAGVYV